jgi:Zn-dependent protease with chaperone function
MNISPHVFIHPEDRAALENLESIPLFSSCVKMFMKIVTEQFLHGVSMAQKIRLGPEQLPNIYQHLPHICAVLGIAEPEFYLEMNPSPNAYTYGDTRPMITVTSGLVEYLEEDELQAVLAHECGHIVCRHVLYHTIADMLIKFGSAIFGPLAAVSAPIRLALLYWYRRSELSADRAAAVALRNPKPVVETMIRLAGGPKSITAKVNIDLYVQQADAYDKLQDSDWDKLLQSVAVMDMDHPFLAVRTREITQWCASPDFQRLVEAITADEATPKCPGCGRSVKENWRFCGACGHPNTHLTPATPTEDATHG